MMSYLSDLLQGVDPRQRPIPGPQYAMGGFVYPGDERTWQQRLQQRLPADSYDDEKPSWHPVEPDALADPHMPIMQGDPDFEKMMADKRAVQEQLRAPVTESGPQYGPPPFGEQAPPFSFGRGYKNSR
jgi:hypothetical protein